MKLIRMTTLFMPSERKLMEKMITDWIKSGTTCYVQKKESTNRVYYFIYRPVNLQYDIAEKNYGYNHNDAKMRLGTPVNAIELGIISDVPTDNLFKVVNTMEGLVYLKA